MSSPTPIAIKVYADPRLRVAGQRAREVGAYLAQLVREGKPITPATGKGG